MCRTCSSGYMSNGYCCDTGKYHKLGQGCINIPVNNCEKYDGVECSQCTNTLTDFNRCCTGEIFKEKSKGCVTKDADWNEIDIFNDVLISCAAGKYPISDTTCCSDGEFWKIDAVNGDGCVAFATATDCKQTYKVIDTDTYANCKECATANHMLYYGEGCQDNTDPKVSIKIAGTITVVDKGQLYTNCA